MFPERCGGAAKIKRKEGWCVSKNKIHILWTKYKKHIFLLLSRIPCSLSCP
jgi:hypothetical protein